MYDDFIKSILLYPYDNDTIFDTIINSFKQIKEEEKIKEELDKYKSRYLGLKSRAILNLSFNFKKSLVMEKLENVNYSRYNNQNYDILINLYEKLKKEINKDLPYTISSDYDYPNIDNYIDIERLEEQHIYICIVFFKYLLNDPDILNNFILDFLFSTDLIKYAEIYNQFPFFKYFLLYQFIYDTNILKEAIIKSINKLNNKLILHFYFKYMYNYTNYYIKHAYRSEFNNYFTNILKIPNSSRFISKYWSVSKPITGQDGQERFQTSNKKNYLTIRYNK